jgi:FdrA protein
MTELRWSLHPNVYHDSVKLMRVSEALAAEPGVISAAAVMATPLNVDLLAADGLMPAGVRPGSDDLLVAVLGKDPPAAESALRRADELLRMRREVAEAAQAAPPRSLEAAAAAATVAVIGVPGPFAAAEAFAALRSGLHVFLFSDNVPLEDEVRLKALAARLNLLMMGPDCGTAIIGGVGLGFANRVERGRIGIVGASGTGIQQVCCLLDAAGVGVAQAIGTGGRDLSPAVGGSMTRRALKILDADQDVELIAVISKPASAGVTRRLHKAMTTLSRPVIACLLGETPADEGNVRYAGTLKEAAETIISLAGREDVARDSVPAPVRRPASRRGTLELPTSVVSHCGATRERSPAPQVHGPGLVHGLFAGGTLCTEAGRVLDGLGVAHHLIDLGADEYTRGRAHPLIDPRLRTTMLADLGNDQTVAAVLLDVVLGDLAHPDPAGALLPGLEAFRAASPAPIVATLVGARRDPQGLDAQRATLEQAGVQVFAANLDAATVAGYAVRQ